MQPMTIPEIVSAVGGTWLNPREGTAPVSAVSTDSRRIAPGCLFLPLAGEKFDGHDFLDRALAAGAAGCLCARVPETLRPDKFYIRVEDTRLALKALASAYRDRFPIPFIQVTGSVGKTTTKEMLASVLGAKLCVLKTPENFNNDIGTPLTLLGLGPEHQAAVIETGMNHFGEIRYLGEMVRPDIAVISNIGDAHIEYLGSREGILKAKSEIFENLKPGGLAVLNGDDALLNTLDLPFRTVRCGHSEHCAVRVTEVADHGVAGITCTIVTQRDTYHLNIPAPGEHMAWSAAIAVAVGPGSFTGIRIGVAAAKGLAWPEDKPCAPCSTLESMAWPLAHLEGRVIVCAMDARRSQVYNALFLAAGEGLQRLTPDRAIGLDQLGEELKKVEKEKIVVGDGARLCYNTLTEQGITLKMAPEHLRMQSAWGVARAALELVRSGGLVSGEELAPVYCRLSQAERERLEREAKSK